MNSTRVIVLACATVALTAAAPAAPAQAARHRAAKSHRCARGTKRRGRRCVVIRPPKPKPAKGPSSLGKLDAAIAQHQLSTATAALYEAYAVFGDARLPKRYRSAGALPPEDAERAINDVIAAYAKLPRTTKARLKPFLRSPLQRGSWFALAHGKAHGATAAASANPVTGEWEAISSSEARVWWWKPSPFAADDAAIARSVLEELTHRVWPKETALMGRTPISDAATGNGEDGRLDILIMPSDPANPRHPPPAGLTLSFNPSCAKGPRYIELGDASYQPIVIAHEFFHALVAAFDHLDCTDDRWWDEGTARWVQTYVYGHSDSTFDADASNYLTGFEGRGAYFLSLASDANDYPSALFAYDIAKLLGPETIRRSWEGAGTKRIANAIDDAIASGGGFASVWPDFGLQIVNVADGYRHLKEWLGYDETATRNPDQQGTADVPDSPVQLGKGKGLQELGIPALSFRVYDEDVKAAGTRSWAFFNPWLDGGASPPPGLSVHALIHTAAGWTQEDWTNRASRFFCRQLPADRLDRLVLVLGNAAPYSQAIEAPGGTFPELIASPAGCRGWSGTVTGSQHQASEGQTTDQSWTAHVHFVPSAAPVETTQLDALSYALEPTTIQWGGLSGSVGECSVNDPPASFAVGPDDGDLVVDALAPSWSPLAPAPPVYGGSSQALQEVTPGTMQCPSEDPQDTFDTVLTAPWFATADPALGLGPNALRAFADASGGHLSGTTSFHPDGADDTTTTITWDLTADPDS